MAPEEIAPYDGDDLDEMEAAIYAGSGVAPAAALRHIARTRALEQDAEMDELTWRCRSCSTDWAEDDLEQVQPDGHYACPSCVDPFTLVALPLAAMGSLRAAILEQTLARPGDDIDECGEPSGYHDDGDPMLCTLAEGHAGDHAHHNAFTWTPGTLATDAAPDIDRGV